MKKYLVALIIVQVISLAFTLMVYSKMTTEFNTAGESIDSNNQEYQYTTQLNSMRSL